MVKIIKTPILETKRLLLRPRTLEDSDILQKYFNNWNIIKHLNENIPWPYPENGSHLHFTENVLPRIKAGTAMMWSICLKENTAHPIGLIEYRLKCEAHHDGDRGFWLAEPYWRQNLMTEAVSALNDYVFDVLGRKKIRVQNYTDNTSSHRVKEKTGTTLLETKIVQWRGEDRETEIWELTSEDWRKFKQNH